MKEVAIPPGIQLKVYGDVPPEGFTVACPVDVLQAASIVEALRFIPPGWPTDADCTTVQLLASVTVTK
jgi:hypothetical protein